LHQINAFSSLYWTKKEQYYLESGQTLLNFDHRTPQREAALDWTLSTCNDIENVPILACLMLILFL
tara:strand:- start:2886 stop:3083 length:198 start_codon:yes stop_codon:yes gene_type:complete